MYNALAQTDRLDAASSASDDASDRSPALGSPVFAPLALDFDNFGGSEHRDAASTAPDSLLQTATTAIMRQKAASYELVEADEYAVPEKAPERMPETENKPEEPVMQTPRSRRNSTPLRHPTPDLQSIQGAYIGNVERLEKSAERMSMEVEAERVLETLNRMSMPRSRATSGASIANSRASPGSPGASAAAATSISASGYGSLSRQSSLNRPRLRSGSSASRLAHIIEPENEGAAEMAPPTIPPPPEHRLEQQPLQYGQQQEQQYGQQNEQQYGQYEQQNEQGERPESAGSGDTYQQSTNLFKDFDGVHFTPHIREVPRSRGVSLSKPPLAAEAEHYNNPPPGQDVVYYPAPVPMMLNLPQRLSRKPPMSEQEKRRTQLINSISPEARKSAAWITDAEQGSNVGDRMSKRLSNLPPQLRASAFFDAPKTQIDVRIQGESAVDTLESILDAAAHAPVSAFTDHPIVGHLGADVYKQKRAKNKINKKRRSAKPDGTMTTDRSVSSTTKPGSHIRTPSDGQMLDNVDESTSLRSNFDEHASHGYSRTPSPLREAGAHEEDDEEEEEEEDEEEEDDDEGKNDEPIFGPPTTLLAELQMRKHQQKMRTRTAATAFPNGMHSTLLELDSVAQRQREKRDKGRVTLAWEGHQGTGQDELDDDDVPLGVLFPEQSRLQDENRPLGLMEKLVLEESEPLSRRRARIRGEPLNTARAATPRNLAARDPSPNKRASTAYTLDIPGLTDNNVTGNEESGDEEETLAQRKNRLKARDSRSDFDDLISKFGDLDGAADKDKTKDAPATSASAAAAAQAAAEPEEETLGQRRKRLQAEAKLQSASASATSSPFQARRTMANVLQAHPARPGLVTAHSELDMRYRTPAAMASTHSLLNLPPTRASMLTSTTAPFSMAGHRLSGAPMLPYSHGPPPGTAPAMLNGSGMLGSSTGAGGFGYPTNGFVYNPASMHPVGGQQEMIDPRQRDMIDRWRLSVRQ
ncbi:TPA_exp: Uncharacterized protein A8136_3836 [Trichophyton benhamiae CBS 112371]|uniref:Uncharacterized protein n=1 Tax=Arthroderma benhamiae (strain ATCC MYA-4681 / CBS 112371) TaxID=663331 RepID=D4B1L7_ARTBC|nr:uncharacterized protein ARB_02346 [Trichophyton benhamiae CBS 112371]EFE30856.1 conserved hypothetical protein [Trichophyton benhamiae CBS 112371]DAA74054.1 TPA_exp: Uncharacterized protein A8136_3836 [Trichophyton benhamiae CBS 112371]